MKTMRSFTVAATVALVLVLGGDAKAQKGGGSAYVVFNPASFSYPSGDPDVLPVSSAPQITMLFKLAGVGQGSWHMTIRSSDFTPAGVIPVGNVTWTATCANPDIAITSPGTLSMFDQPIASGTTNITKEQTAYFTFHLQNLWTYTAGTYSHTITVTLSQP
jgi:hypothetical protein